jgi:hypothetical protein
LHEKWGYLLALLTLLEILSAVLYLGKAGQFGLPLDDAWIHQTYARNLGLNGVMAFSLGQPSTGRIFIENIKRLNPAKGSRRISRCVKCIATAFVKVLKV